MYEPYTLVSIHTHYVCPSVQRGIVHSHQVTFSSALAEGRATLKSDYLMVKNGDEIIAKLSDSSLLPQSLSEDRLEPIKYVNATCQ